MQGYFSRSLFVRIHLVSVIRMLLSWYSEGILLTGNLCPAFRHKVRVQRALPHLLFLKCLGLKIINMSMWHILGWQVLDPLQLDRGGERRRGWVSMETAG